MIGALAGLGALVLVGLAAQLFDLALSPSVWLGLTGLNVGVLVIVSLNQPVRRKWF